MGLKGRLRFARKPISVIGNIALNTARKPISVIGKVIVNTWDSKVVSDSLGNLYQL